VQNKDDPIPRRVKLGDLLEGTSWRLVELQPRRASFEGPQGRRDLELRVFDGTGAPMPATPVAARPAPDTIENAEPVAPPPAAVPAPLPALPMAQDEPVEMTPEQQVEAIRRRIEARRAMRAQEGAEERAAMERAKQVE
jgi:general secretion pathway protein N